MSEKTTVEKQEGVRSFGTLLGQLDDGQFLVDTSEAAHGLYKELFAHAENHEKAKGTITIVLSLSAQRNGAVAIHSEVKIKSPKKARGATIFFGTPGDNLSVENPRQQKLALREVGAPKEAREAKVESTTAKSVDR